MNKYANQYLDGLKEKLLAYKPFNQQESFEAAPEGAALGAIAGGGIGALSGLASDPGYDAQGRKKSRIKESLKGLIKGGLVGAGAGALGTMALPAIGSGAIDIYSKILKNKVNKSTEINDLDKMFGNKVVDAAKNTSQLILPGMTTEQLIDSRNNLEKIRKLRELALSYETTKSFH